MNRKISLPLIPKTERGLMPEILPDPGLPLQPSAAARDRVRVRLQKMRESAAVLAAAAAGLGVGCSEQHGGGEPPPPAGNGAAGNVVAAGSGGAGQAGASGAAGKAGAGGTAGNAGRTGGGGVAGYAVVDPMPLPFICSKAPAFTNSNTSAEWSGGGTLQVSARVLTQDGAGSFLNAVSTDAANIQASVFRTGFPATAQLKLQSGSWPREVLVHLDFMCRLDTGGYGTHRVTLRLDTSKPADSGTVPILIGGDEDAGT